MTHHDAKTGGRHRSRSRGVIIAFLLGFFSFAGILVVVYLLAPVIQENSIMPPRPLVPKAELNQRRQAILEGLVTTKDRNTLALVERMHTRIGAPSTHDRHIVLQDLLERKTQSAPNSGDAFVYGEPSKGSSVIR